MLPKASFRMSTIEHTILDILSLFALLLTSILDS